MDKWGYSNESGNIIIQPKYDRVFFFNSTGIAKVQVGKFYYLINKDGIELTNVGYTSIGNFVNGLAPCCIGGELNVMQGEIVGGKWGYISEENYEFKIPAIFSRAYEFKGKYAIVQTENNWGNWGVIDSKGNQILPFNYPTYRFDTRPYPGLQWHYKSNQLQADISGIGEKWNIIDLKGNKISGPVSAMHGIYDYNSPNEKYAQLCKAKEKLAESALEKALYQLKSGNRIYKSTGDLSYINTDYFIAQIIDSARKSWFGVVDAKLNILVPFRYENISTFTDANSLSEINSNTWLVVSKAGLYGFCAINGNETIKCKYPFAENFNGNFAKVYLSKTENYSNSYGYINRAGKEYFEAPIEFTISKLNGKYKITDQYYNEITLNDGTIYEHVQYIANGKLFLVQTDKEQRVYDLNLKFIVGAFKISALNENLIMVYTGSNFDIYSVTSSNYIAKNIFQISAIYSYTGKSSLFYVYRNIDGKYGMCKNDGKKLLNDVYNKITANSIYFVVDKENGLSSILDSNANEIKPFIAESIQPITDHLYLCSSKFGAQFYDIRTKATTKYQPYLSLYKRPETSFSYKSKSGLYGFVDIKNEIIFPPDYKQVSSTNYYDNKDALVQVNNFLSKNKTWSVLYNGKFILFDIKVGEIKNAFSYGITVKNGITNKWRVYDFSGQPITEEYEDIKGFAGKKVFGVKQNNKWGLITEKGEIILPMDYAGIEDCFDDYVIAKNSNEKIGVLNFYKGVVVPFEYDDLFLIKRIDAEENNYFFYAAKGEKSGIIDLLNSIHAPFEFSANQEFNQHFYTDSIFTLSKNKKVGLYRYDGKELISQLYDELLPFYLYNPQEREVILARKEKLFGLFSAKGESILKTEYDNIVMNDEWNNPITGEYYYLASKNKKLGVFNAHGKFTIDPIYDDIINVYSENKQYQIVKKNAFKGLYKGFETMIAPCEYSNFIMDEEYFFRGLFVAQKGNRFAVMDTSGKLLTEFAFDKFNYYDEAADDFLWEIQLNRKKGLIGADGKIALQPEFDKFDL